MEYNGEKDGGKNDIGPFLTWRASTKTAGGSGQSSQRDRRAAGIASPPKELCLHEALLLVGEKWGKEKRGRAFPLF